MSKIQLWYFIISLVVIVGLVMTVIITAQAGRIRNYDLNQKVKELKQENQSLEIKVKQRDNLLKKIRTSTKFKNAVQRTKQVIAEWEILIEAEKSTIVQPLGADLSNDLTPKW